MTVRLDLLGGLRVVGGSNRDKFGFEFRHEGFSLEFSDREAAKLLAEAIEQTIRENLLAGRAPDGRPLPRSKPKTLERRRYRIEQAARGGKAHPRYKDGNFKRKVRSNFRKRFRAPRVEGHVGGIHQPGAFGVPKGRVGVESGLLARSVKAVAKGEGYTIFFANVRALADQHGRSALTRVFGRGRVPVWSRQAMDQPHLDHAAREVVGDIMGARRERSLSEFLSATTGLAGSLAQFGGELLSL